MAHALVLNATYEPLCVVTRRRALLLVLAAKAVPVEDSDTVLHSSRATLSAPAVIRLVRYVRVPYAAHVPLTRRSLFARDGGRCVYCGAAAATIDHVVPRSRGGRHEWTNVVSACHRCNHLKADRAFGDLGWRLRSVPTQPTGMAWRIVATGRSDPCWAPYLAAFGADLLGTEATA